MLRVLVEFAYLFFLINFLGDWLASDILLLLQLCFRWHIIQPMAIE